MVRTRLIHRGTTDCEELQVPAERAETSVKSPGTALCFDTRHVTDGEVEKTRSCV